MQRLRFEHPEVGAVVITSGNDKAFCAGANIRMLATSSHAWKVNFCKFTNETRCGVEDASANSGQRYIAAVNGTASGGGYEIALACDQILLVDDGSAALSLPEAPLLGVLPGTGGLTRLTDKRKVRRDRADVLATKAEGIKGRAAVAWGLADEVIGKSRFGETVAQRARQAAAASPRAARAGQPGVALAPLDPSITADAICYRHVRADLDRPARLVTITVAGPAGGSSWRPAPGRGRLLAAGDDQGTRRPHPVAAHQRARARHLDAAHPRRYRPRCSRTSAAWPRPATTGSPPRSGTTSSGPSSGST